MRNKRILLTSRPKGWPTLDDFQLDERPLGEPADGEILVRNIFLSVDPYMRGRMNKAKSYVAQFELGEPLEGGVVGRVVASRKPEFAESDYVTGMLRWEEYSISDGKGLQKVDPEVAPISYSLGILGMPGMTAYVGLVGIGKLRAGENVFVTAASGAVGSVAGQIAKNLGCYVAGSAGSESKVEYLTDELGFDDAFNYKTEDSAPKAVRRVCPHGIDVLFENAGGPVFEAAIWNMNTRGRIALCGLISDYNRPLEEMPPGPRGLAVLIARSVTLQGFIVLNYPELCGEWVAKGGQWLREGKLKYRESVVEGIENAPAAFIGMMKGENFGKQLVKLCEET